MDEPPAREPPDGLLALLWYRLGHVDDTSRRRAFAFGVGFLVVAGVTVTVERFTGTLVGALPLVCLAMVAVAIGDLSRDPNHVALARLTALALGVAVVAVWTTGAA